MSVKILADSACDLPLSFYTEHGVTLFPLKVHLDGQEYEDLRTIDPETVYQAIRDGKTLKTSQASPLAFEETFTQMAINNEDGIYIAFSSQLSGTYQTAVMIVNQVKENYPNFNLTVVDSKCASLGYGLLVKEAAKLASQSVSKEEILNDIMFRKENMEQLFTVDDLEHLAKGGRVSKASAFVGGLLNIKPLLNVEDGKLVPIDKIRGKKKLLRRIIELMRERGTSLEEQEIGISHAQDEETALEMKKMIVEEFHPKEVTISLIGASVGSHTGPGAIAIFFLKKIS
ncbi:MULTISPECIES: DegV family protein [unclassified Bacillus (in: firmicutes)]|uniref:DegV family protein n=1 Tax=unclassified Bacillus (in: firmicutes) TaxID=185979 RepID=UPI0008E06778|nr:MULTISPECIES: DegV family protein [unclassified Bacillus (in: firmicutes)]SFA79095.1 EDD domain protein, DegV family [Bacillus sp. UNCCL13]SFQ69050.1 EDD domain protein, DegV family [Bacillus sp. cl95]